MWRWRMGRIVAQLSVPSIPVAITVVSTIPLAIAWSSNTGFLAWRSIFIRRLQGVARVPAAGPLRI